MPRITPLQVAMGVGAAGAMVDVSTYASLGDGFERSWGRQNEFDHIFPGTFSVVLDNPDGRFTPGNTASALTTTVTEGMAVSVNLGGRLTAGTIQSIEPTFPGNDSAWAQIRITCDDMLGSAGRRTLADDLIESLTDGGTPLLFWPLDDENPTVSPRETASVLSGLLTLTTTNGSSFGATALDVSEGTQLTLKDSLASSGSLLPTFDFTYPTSTLGFYNFWITPTSASKITCSVGISGLARTFQFGYNGTEYFVRDGDAGTSDTWGSTDTGPHFVSMGLGTVYAASNWDITATLYVDGVSRGSIVYGSAVASLPYRAPVSLTLRATV